MSRTVTLVLVDDAGSPLGALPPFDVEVPWWPEVSDVVDAARRRHGVDVTVLRLLAAERPVPPGGAVTYLAQVSRDPGGLTAVEIDRSDHPLRADYARVGGPADTLRWAAARLAEVGLGPVTDVTQRKTWNLSALWRLTTPAGPVWIKQVPAFFAHEGAVIGWITRAGLGALVPRLIAADGGRMLLAHVAGEDHHGAPAAMCGAIAADMHAIQAAAVTTVDTLIDLGVPDRRSDPLRDAVEAVAARWGDGDPRLVSLVAGLPERLAKVESCGVPDTLVHGDLHPGNVRADGDGPRVIIDWGDSCVAHPAFDLFRVTDGVTPAEAAAITDEWVRRWSAHVPGSDPATAIDLLRPVAALRAAVAYAQFVSDIEPSEHPYHASDVPLWLARAAEFAG